MGDVRPDDLGCNCGTGKQCPEHVTAGWPPTAVLENLEALLAQYGPKDDDLLEVHIGKGDWEVFVHRLSELGVGIGPLGEVFGVYIHEKENIPLGVAVFVPQRPWPEGEGRYRVWGYAPPLVLETIPPSGKA